MDQAGQDRDQNEPMPPATLPVPIPRMVATPNHLAALLNELETHDCLAVDTEADSLHCYFEKLCLVQISIPGHDILVDPLAGLDLKPLMQLFERKELVFHAMDFDLRMLRRVAPFAPANIFDTAIAGKLLGYKELGLAAMLRRHFGLEINKASQKEDWGRRPLPEKMIDYAMTDTRHLLDLRTILTAELKRLGRWEWFVENCRRTAKPGDGEKPRDPEKAWKVGAWKDLSPRGRAVLRALWNWREEEARRRDRPTFYVIGNDDLVRAATAYDKGEEFSSRSLKGNTANSFTACARKALALPPDQWPPPAPRTARPLRMTPEQEGEVTRLKLRRDEIATKLELDPSVIASRTTLEGLVVRREETLGSMQQWQIDLVRPFLDGHPEPG